MSGGIGVKQQTRSAVRVSGLILPLILIPYGLIVRSSVLGSTHYSSDAVLLLIVLPWVVLALSEMFMPTKTKRDIQVRTALYHVFAAAYILFVSGFTTPLIAAWTLLLLATYMYLGKPGLFFNFGMLLATALANVFLHHGENALLLQDTLSVIAIFIVGVLMVYLHRTNQTDTTALTRSKAKESLQRDRINTLINNLADAVISTDEKGIVEVYNAAALNLLNTNTSLNGRPVSKILDVRDQEGNAVNIYSDLKGKRGLAVRDDLSMTIDDETIRLEITSSPIRSTYSRTKKPDSPDGYMLILRDITKAKSLEEERDEFISVVSHELRTPITVAEGTISNVQLMVDRGDLPKTTLKKSLEMAHDQVLFLAKMVNDLSTLSRAERGVADSAEIIDVRQLVEGLFREYAPQAEKKHLHFNLDAKGSLGKVTASRLYLHELLQNFITNSIKYTKEGSVTLKVENDGQKVHFEVTDTGIGISKSDQAKIFQKFYRSEDYRTRETGGTGLGLYVAAKLARKLHTNIEVKSRLNHGSTFGIFLPAETE